jgi:hypothetical protein
MTLKITIITSCNDPALDLTVTRQLEAFGRRKNDRVFNIQQHSKRYTTFPDALAFPSHGRDVQMHFKRIQLAGNPFM